MDEWIPEWYCINTKCKRRNYKKSGVNKITITYGTETGNSKKLATTFAAKAKKQGIHAKVQSLEQYKVNDLAKEEYFLLLSVPMVMANRPPLQKNFMIMYTKMGLNLIN